MANGSETKASAAGLARASRWFSNCALALLASGALLAATVVIGGPTVPGDTSEPASQTQERPEADSQVERKIVAPSAASIADGAATGQAPNSTDRPAVPVELQGAAAGVDPAKPETAVRDDAVVVVPAPGAAPPATAAAAGDASGTPGLKPAKVLFGGVKTPAPLEARAIGSYAKGCLAGATALPVDGPAWQAMRLSRNRHWGHPKLINLIQKLAKDGREKDGWPGLLVGDLSQPRGGPMLTGHASHQIGLDADVWLTPMPDRRLSNEERESMSAISMLADDATSVAREKWSEGHLNILKRAASYPEVERVLVHPAIKQVLCYAAEGDRSWLSKVRPYWGHHYHFHIRIACPPGSSDCVAQVPPPGDDGCGKELDDWLRRIGNAQPQVAQPIPLPPAKPEKPPPAPITLDKLPQECRVVIETENPDAKADVEAAISAANKAKLAKDKASPARPKEKAIAVGSVDGPDQPSEGARTPPVVPSAPKAAALPKTE